MQHLKENNKQLKRKLDRRDIKISNYTEQNIRLEKIQKDLQKEKRKVLYFEKLLLQKKKMFVKEACRIRQLQQS